MINKSDGNSWPQGSTGVERYGCIPLSPVRDPSNNGSSAYLVFRGRHGGGVEKGGGWNTSRMTPHPKMGFGPPPPPSYGTFSTPLGCQSSVLPAQKSTTKQTRSSFGGFQKFSGERVLWYVFLPPYVLHPPYLGNGANTVSGSTVSDTELSELFWAHRVSGRELSEFLSAYYLRAKANSPSFPRTHRVCLKTQ